MSASRACPLWQAARLRVPRRRPHKRVAAGRPAPALRRFARNGVTTSIGVRLEAGMKSIGVEMGNGSGLLMLVGLAAALSFFAAWADPLVDQVMAGPQREEASNCAWGGGHPAPYSGDDSWLRDLGWRQRTRRLRFGRSCIGSTAGWRLMDEVMERRRLAKADRHSEEGSRAPPVGGHCFSRVGG
jgi:hypothetical protein